MAFLKGFVFSDSDESELDFDHYCEIGSDNHLNDEICILDDI